MQETQILVDSLKYLLLLGLIIYFIYNYVKVNKQNAKANVYVPDTERRNPSMKLYRLVVEKDGSTIYSCVLSTSDFAVSLPYWCDQGATVKLLSL